MFTSALAAIAGVVLLLFAGLPNISIFGGSKQRHIWIRCHPVLGRVSGAGLLVWSLFSFSSTIKLALIIITLLLLGISMILGTSSYP